MVERQQMPRHRASFGPMETQHFALDVGIRVDNRGTYHFLEFAFHLRWHVGPRLADVRAPPIPGPVQEMPQTPAP